MISNNFDFLKNETKIKFDWTYEKLSIMEDSIVKDDQYTIPVEATKLLEKLFKQIINDIDSKRPLYKLKNDFQIFFKEEYDVQVPTSIWASINFISKDRNSNVHDNIDPDYGKSSQTFTNKLNYLMCIRKILHFCINVLKGEDIEIEDFKDDIYYRKANKHKYLEDAKAYKYENNQIRLEKIAVGDFILNNNNNFLIPSYQRDYRWGEEECQELLNQLISKYKTQEQVYFGALACRIIDNHSLTEDHTKNDILDQLNMTKQIRLIDGQQRVTTSLILFKVFYDLFKEKIVEEVTQENFKMPLELLNLFEYKENNEYSDKKIKEKYINSTAGNESGQNGIYVVLKGYKNKKNFQEQLNIFKKAGVIDNYDFF
ncbi:hypothetical protein SHELI_v1c03550 [Spiroplasma helicoides]|uniref:GmrSD restriction endonucleases N-terminal domain-containing protein n=1 Tax=Spiroplasma helicoides TaxID=216938 RepID=A0A1B3SK57_9MOLU|nr:DUF262 domain-containing protein [Spiroplasma helicoides]AOG60310.1 hypothetical protein SHELI_v1c03550 [Spiroplasma helicoides]